MRGKRVLMINPDNNIVIKEFENGAEASKYLGKNRRVVGKAIQKNKIYCGYLWKYKIINEEDNKDENWKTINYKGKILCVSDLGRLKDENNIEINTSETQHGYLIISIKSKSEYVHRIVATAFLENPNNYLVINHKDNNGKNNKVENLEWCTQQHNSIHGVQYRNSYNTNNCRDVYKFEVKTKKIVKKYNSISEACKHENIKNIYKRIIDESNIDGYIFSYNKKLNINNIKETKLKKLYKFQGDTKKLIKTYDSIEIAAKEENISPSTMRRISLNNILYKGYIYSRNNILSEVNELKKASRKKIKIKKLDPLSNISIKEYNSLSELVNELKIPSATIRYKIKNQKLIDGYLYQKI